MNQALTVAVRLADVLDAAVLDGLLTRDEAAAVMEDHESGAAARERAIVLREKQIEQHLRDQAEARRREAAAEAARERDRWDRFLSRSHEWLTEDVGRGHLDRAQTVPYLAELHQLAAGFGIVLGGCRYCSATSRRAA